MQGRIDNATRIIFYLAELALIAALACSDMDAAVSEVQVEGKVGEYFQFGEFRAWIPPNSHYNRVLVLTLGENQCGLQLADDHKWQSLAESLKCSLLTCFFAPDRSLPRWDLAANGTGRALLRCLSILAKSTDNPQMADAKLFLVGDSTGGQFSYHFAAWKPDRVLGFVSLKGGYHDVSSAPTASTVPGLFVLGQFDLPYRLDNIRKVFAAGRGLGSPWCLAVEPNAGHEPGTCFPLVAAFLQALTDVPPLKETSPGIANRGLGVELEAPKVDSLTSWFPTTSFKKKWEIFQSTGTIADSPTLSFQSQTPMPLAVANPVGFELAPVPSQEKSPIITLQILQAKPNLWDHAKILPCTYLSDFAPNKISSQATLFSFRFNPANVPLGQFSGEIPVRFILQGKPVLGGLNVPLSTKIVGDVVANPPSIYLGPVIRDSKITMQIKISSEVGKLVQFLSCDKPDGVGITTPPKPSNPLFLTFSFEFTKQDSAKLNSASGVILLHLKTDREWVLRIPYIGTVVE